MKLFVFGGGYSAQAAITALRAEKSDIAFFATSRDAEKAKHWGEAGVTGHVFDGETPGPTLSPDLQRATHLLVSIGPGPAGDAVLNRYGGEIMEAPDLQWIGYYSTIGVYGDADGQWIDETAPTDRSDARLAARLDAEAGWAELAREKGVPLAVLRLGGIYGPGRSAFDKLRAGTAQRINKPGQVFNRIHVGDIGGLTAAAALGQRAGVFNVVDAEPAPPQDVVTYAAQKLGVAPPLEVDFATAPMSAMARSFYANNRRVSGQAILTALDYALRFPTYRHGLDAILAAEGEEAGD